MPDLRPEEAPVETVDGMRPWAASHRFTDAGDLAASLADAGAQYVPLAGGPYESSLTLLGLGATTAQRARDQAHVVRARMHADRAVMLLPVRSVRPPVINGVEVGAVDGLLLPPGSALHGLCPGAVDWGSFSVPAAHALDLLDLAETPAMPRGERTMLRMPATTAASLQAILVAATDLGARIADPADAAAYLASLADAIGENIAAAFSRSMAPAPVPRATHQAIRLVDASEAYMREHQTRPVYLEELCTVLEVSPRTLHKAFVATCGMSPHTYLRRRRLMQVHDALKAAGPGAAPLVKSVALGHGFWHLGHFARAYREMFGYPPSETRARARPERGARIPAAALPLAAAAG
jgi:AraC family ethanolamine operon transcriptional activator